jgi:hypothetical protein
MYSVAERSYLIRYGLTGHVGRFASGPDCAVPFERGQFVVIQTQRGLELGEVLIRLRAADEPDGTSDATGASEAEAPGQEHATKHVLRLAGSDDVSRNRDAEALRADRFVLCERVLEKDGWPWQLIDVEPLLDPTTTVLHYLGPGQLDVGLLRARFRRECGLDIVLEPAGTDATADDGTEPAGAARDLGGCGHGGCSEGGCDRGAPPDPATRETSTRETRGACGTSTGSGCASCGIRTMVAARKRGRA